MIRRPPRSKQSRSSAASDVYKRQLNNLTSTSYLFMHKKYTLPIHLYNYNGKSIRSTLGIDDWKKAVRIKEYNEALLDRGVRSTHFTSSKILWVPSPELDKEKPIAVTTTTDDSDTKSNHTTPSPTPIALQSFIHDHLYGCLLYTSPSPRDQRGSRMPSSA